MLQNVTAAIAGPATLSGNLATISRSLSELDQSLGEARLRIARVLGHVTSDDSGHDKSQAAAAGQSS